MENKIIDTIKTDNGFTITVEIINVTPYGKTEFVEDFRTFMGKKGLNIKNTKEAYPLNGVYFTFVDLTDDQLNLIKDKIFEYNNDMEYNETINTNKLYTSINEFKQYLKESVRRRMFPYFTYTKSTGELTYNTCDNDLAQDAINDNDPNDDMISFCGSDWSMSYCETIGKEVKQKYESGVDTQTIIDELFEEEY